MEIIALYAAGGDTMVLLDIMTKRSKSASINGAKITTYLASKRTLS